MGFLIKFKVYVFFKFCLTFLVLFHTLVLVLFHNFNFYFSIYLLQILIAASVGLTNFGIGNRIKLEDLKGKCVILINYYKIIASVSVFT